MLHARLLVTLAVLALVVPGPGLAASKRKIAVLGDPAPGDGQFAGPAFASTPGAAGNGFMVFRAQVASGTTSEQIVVQNVVTGERRSVASLGEAVSDRIGRFKQFLGRPTVNAQGDVAFVATLSPGPETPKADPTDPVPAGVFVRRGRDLDVVALAGSDTGFGKLDLVTALDLLSDDINATDTPERTPALDDAGNVAFLGSAVRGSQLVGAIFTRAPGQAPVVAVKYGDAWEQGRLVLIGPPVLSPSGVLAYRGVVDGQTQLDGIFRVAGGTTSVLVSAGFDVPIPDTSPPISQPVEELGDVFAMNDAGDLAFTGGPLIDVSASTTASDDLVPGVFVYHAGTTTLLGWPGRVVEDFGRISDFALSADLESTPTPPVIAPDGTVVFHALLNAGVSSLLLRAAPPDYDLRVVSIFGGKTPSSSPVGGIYLAASSAPAVDAALGIVFAARVAGSTTSEVLVYLPPSGPAIVDRLGDPVPDRGSGFFGGPPFFPPRLNDAGTVVFKSYVVAGPGLGIFRSDAGGLSAVVRSGDLAPLDGAPPPHFIDFPGDPSLNLQGDVAFSGVTDDGRRGVFVASAGSVRAVAVTDEDFLDETRPAAWFRAVAPNPAIDDAGAVVFRATIEYPDPIDPFGSESIVEDGLFRADPQGIVLVVFAGQRSPAGQPYFRFRDPSASGERIAFRAPLGRSQAIRTGIFLVDPTGILPVAIENDPLADGMTLGELSGRPAVSAAGTVAFLGKVRGTRSGQALLRGVAGAVAPVAVVGDTGPAGGTFRSLGRPALSSNGHLAFRANFQPFTGGITSFFLSTPETGIRTHLSVGEQAPAAVGGRLASLNQNVAVNERDQMAFIAGIADGASRTGIFLSSPARVAANPIQIRLRPASKKSLSAHDRIKLQAVLTPGPDGDGLDPERDPVAITLSDTTHQLWSVTLPKDGLVARGKKDFRPKNLGALRSQLRALGIRLARDGSARVRALSAPLDLTFSGAQPLVPPLTLRVEIGDDAATATVPCSTKGRRIVCSGS